MNDIKQEEKMVSIWTWVGLILSVYGVMIIGAGIYNLSQPVTTVLGELNPNLWWGAIMLLGGIIFLLIPRFAPDA